ncbi:uncharacterized protein [Parasteatoda tepidariorum]|uniref:uncharacterized protein n=1 Tax=Parasteatoda tepidariorum TaxID=114398 RepID=UPI001C71A193|nr:uncharacterized protein LOC107439469 [Parasteatoda tepidariorum]
MDLFSIDTEEDKYEAFTLDPATENNFFSTSATTRTSLHYISISLYKIITISLLAFTFIIIVILFFFTKKCEGICKLSSCQRTVSENYVTVPSEESLERDIRHYGRHISNRDELSSILDIPSNVYDVRQSWNDSEYDNLSLNPALNDSDMIDAPPDYEPPPPYESHCATGIKSKVLQV